MDTKASRKLYKVVVVGETGTGKTALVQRYTGGVFHPRYKATNGVDINVKELLVNDAETGGETLHEIHFWDLAGPGRYGTMTKTHYERVNGFIFVCDYVNPDLSCAGIKKWIADIESKVGLPLSKIPHIFVSTKADLMTDAGKPTHQLWVGKNVDVTVNVDKSGASLKMCYPETKVEHSTFSVSAKHGTGIEDAMTNLLQQMNREGAFCWDDMPVIPKSVVCVLGDPRVGKSAIIRRYTQNVYDKFYKPTIGMHKTSIHVPSAGGGLREIVFVDVAGMEIHGQMTKHYYRDASALLLVADYTNEQSLLNVLKCERNVAKPFLNSSQSRPAITPPKRDARHGTRVSGKTL